MGKQTLKAKEVYRLRISAYKCAWLGASVIVKSENARNRYTRTTDYPHTEHEANDVSVVLELNCCFRGDSFQVKRQRVEN